MAVLSIWVVQLVDTAGVRGPIPCRVQLGEHGVNSARGGGFKSLSSSTWGLNCLGWSLIPFLSQLVEYRLNSAGISALVPHRAQLVESGINTARVCVSIPSQA